MASSNATSDTEKIVVEPIDNSTKLAFVLSDDQGNLNVELNDNFNFKESYFTILEPLSNSLNEAVVKVKNYMLEDSLKLLHVTGYYKSSESNNSAFPNLGLARANAVKNYFVSTGISSKNIDTYGELNDEMIPDNNKIYYGPLAFSMSTDDGLDTSRSEAIQALGEAIKADPLVLYFETGASTLNLTAEQREKVANISRYVDKVHEAKIHIIGHTDNTGDAFSNTKLGQKRAEFVKRYLMGNAISEGFIEATSKGQDEPIASNASEEGREQNRRVVVTIN
jgi:outer membrane protein OmpA-like peptidoglycan-associated protein